MLRSDGWLPRVGVGEAKLAVTRLLVAAQVLLAAERRKRRKWRWRRSGDGGGAANAAMAAMAAEAAQRRLAAKRML